MKARQRQSERNRPIYRERTWVPLWFWILIWGACLLGAGSALHALYVESAGPGALGTGEQPSAGLLVVVSGLLLLLPILLTLVSSCLDVEVRTGHLFVAFGPFHLLHKRIRWSAMEAVEAVSYRPIREFGGWGLRIRKRKTALDDPRQSSRPNHLVQRQAGLRGLALSPSAGREDPSAALGLAGVVPRLELMPAPAPSRTRGRLRRTP